MYLTLTTRENPLKLRMETPAQPACSLLFLPLATPSLGAYPTPPPWLHPKHCRDKDPQVLEKGNNGWKLPRPLYNYTEYYKTSVSGVRINLKKNFSIYSEGFEIQRFHSSLRLSEVRHRMVCVTI